MRTGAIRRWGPCLLAVLTALAVCGWQAAVTLHLRSDRIDAVVPVGRSVTMDGIELRQDSFVVAESLPGPRSDPDAVEHRARPGAVLVAVTVTVRVVDPGRDLETVFCGFDLVDGDRRWDTSSESFLVDLPPALTCSGTDEQPLAHDEPLQVGALFEIPAEAADRVSLQVELATEESTIRFER